MKRQIEALALVSVAKEILAGSSYTPRFIIKVQDYLVWAGKTITNAEWKTAQYGRPSERNIKLYVDRYNISLEPDGVNSHLGRGSAIYGAEIVDQTTGEVVAQWEDRKIMMAYRGKPMFEVVGGDRTAAVRQWITKLISPKGEEFWDAYGPMVKDQKKATKFTNPTAAERAAVNRFGRGGVAFWNSEREHENRAEKEYRDWTYEVEEYFGEPEGKTAKYPDSSPTEKERKLWREQSEKRRRKDGIRPRKAGDNTEILEALKDAEKAIMECRSDVTHQVFTREELMEIRKQVREIVLQSEMLDTACGHTYRLASEK